MATTNAYVPGICNINTDEIIYRRKAGYFGLIIAAIVLLLLFIFNAPQWSRVIVFLPLFIGVLGYLQAKNKFCVAYGAGGKQNAAEGSAGARAVNDAEALAKDRQKARSINVQAAVISALITAAVCFVPNF